MNPVERVASAVECKSGEKAPSRAIPYFRQRTGIDDFYQVHLGERDYLANGARVLPCRKFCALLELPLPGRDFRLST